jgi:uncharacterized damage-inducible protein DinB
MSTKAKVLSPADGVTPGIGLYLSGMDEVSAQVRGVVSDLSAADIGRRLLPETHSIGALVLHIGEAEWFWGQCVLSDGQITDEIRSAPCWDALKDRERVADRGYSAEFCLNEVARIRAQTRTVLAAHDDADLERIYSYEWSGKTREQSMRWILHHLIDHEAQHKGQILMLKRLLGLKEAKI